MQHVSKVFWKLSPQTDMQSVIDKLEKQKLDLVELVSLVCKTNQPNNVDSSRTRPQKREP